MTISNIEKVLMDEQVVVEPEHTTETVETRADLSAFAARYPFPIDAFQLEAMQHLALAVRCWSRAHRNGQDAGG